jgi:diguanylate cyclase (GGDEF)-like protein
MKSGRILIIDDDQHVYDTVDAMLTDIAQETLWAPLPERGIVMAMQEDPDVILLDINMPNMDGVKVCRHLQETDSTRDIPILFLTVERKIASLAHALDSGGSDYILKPFNEIDLRARVRVALRTKYMIDLLREQARIDPLSGLANRAALDETITAHIAAYERHEQPFALLMLDLDNFTKINDSHGHAVGDDLLRTLANELEASCRPYDKPCRYGGDEFAVILGRVEGEKSLRAARRILVGVGNIAVQVEDREIDATCSAGLVSTAELKAKFTGKALIEAADAALYDAKEAGRDRLCVAKLRSS